MTQTCIIVGASHAAAQISSDLRISGWEGDIVIIGDEHILPYHRPPLSKSFLNGQKEINDLFIRDEAFYETNNIQLMLGEKVEKINRDAKQVVLTSGQVLSYDKLVLSTGARVRKVSLPGSDLDGIHYLRSAMDVTGIKQQLHNIENAVIVGGGYIGLETAASLCKLGINVTVLEMAPRVLARVTAPELSAFYERVHAEEGVTIRTSYSVESFTGKTHVKGVLCSNGDEIPADIVIIGVGVIPNVELADAAGLETSNGIVVNEYMATSDSHIVAIGDCVSFYDAFYDRRMRLESVPNAIEQAKCAAAYICNKMIAFHTLPWFWSDQYDLKLQIAGLSEGYDQVIFRGDYETGRSFAAFYFKGSRLIAADCVNRPQEFMLSKRVISNNLSIAPSVLADESIPPLQLLKLTA